MSARLDLDHRQAALDQLGRESLDVLVVGGGIVGAGAALDAVSRGLRVGLVERGDWSSGASGRTSSMVNASWRDVASPDPASVRQALVERGMLVGWLAPHVVHRAPFLYPLVGGPAQRVTAGAQVLFYDAIAQSATVGRSLPAHRHLTRRVVRRLAPALPEVTGGIQFYDAQADDARLVVTVVRTASAYGAHVVHHAEALSLLTDGDRVRGVTVRDRLTGSEVAVEARVVVLAGAAVDPPDAAPRPRDRAVYVLVPRAAIRSSTGLFLPTGPVPARIVPWGRQWLIGPLVTPAGSASVAAPVRSEEVVGLLSLVNSYLATSLRPDQLIGGYAGLLSPRPPAPVTTPQPGLVRAGEARLSTYRLVAARTVDAAARELGGLVAPSITVRLPLLGADGYHARWNQRHLLARRAGLHVARVEHLLNRYGSAADDLLQLVTDRPDLARPLVGAEHYLQAEIVYAVTHEDATDLTDLLVRRTRIAIDTPDGGGTAAPFAAALAAGPLGWTPAQTAAQVATFRTWLTLERAAFPPPPYAP